MGITLFELALDFEISTGVHLPMPGVFGDNGDIDVQSHVNNMLTMADRARSFGILFRWVLHYHHGVANMEQYNTCPSLKELGLKRQLVSSLPY